jgi:hypothetical protein
VGDRALALHLVAANTRAGGWVQNGGLWAGVVTIRRSKLVCPTLYLQPGKQDTAELRCKAKMRPLGTDATQITRRERAGAKTGSRASPGKEMDCVDSASATDKQIPLGASGSRREGARAGATEQPPPSDGNHDSSLIPLLAPLSALCPSARTHAHSAMHQPVCSSVHSHSTFPLHPARSASSSICKEVPSLHEMQA